MLRNSHDRRLLATVATAAALTGTAPAALAMPIDGPIGDQDRAPTTEPVRVVRVQVDEGLDWADAGIGAAGMLAVVLAGFGGAHALAIGSGRRRSTAHP
jgi:hypothetical protein